VSLNLNDVVALGEQSKDLLRDFKSAVGDVVDATKADAVAAARDKAEAFLAQIDEQGRLPVEVTKVADRVQAAELEIARLERERDDAVDEADEAYFGRQLAAFRQESAAWGTAAAYAGVVILSDDDRTELRNLLERAAEDIEQRRNLAGVISATTNLFTITAKLGIQIAKAVP
jgi:hypothetical protein